MENPSHHREINGLRACRRRDPTPIHRHSRRAGAHGPSGARVPMPQHFSGVAASWDVFQIRTHDAADAVGYGEPPDLVGRGALATQRIAQRFKRDIEADLGAMF
jgi:hypothetical protein